METPSHLGVSDTHVLLLLLLLEEGLWRAPLTRIKAEASSSRNCNSSSFMVAGRGTTHPGNSYLKQSFLVKQPTFVITDSGTG